MHLFGFELFWGLLKDYHGEVKRTARAECKLQV